MSEAELPQSPAAPAAAPALSVLPRGLVLAALAVLLAYVAAQGFTLFREWLMLRAELDRVRTTVVVGYPGITPQYSFAKMPANWYHDEGDSTLLWGGWRHGEGHLWFRVGRGEVDKAHISEPLGKDVIRAIDHPVVERGGGLLWSRIPDDAAVVGWNPGGVDTAYPVLVLEKVLVVNDTVAERPFLVVNLPFARKPDERTAVFDPVVDGRRLTLGLTGYFQDSKPLLYDRGTESLWIGEADTVRAIAGVHKGRRLPQVARLMPVAWSLWRSQHPASRLVVGADRSKQLPPQ